MSESYWTNRHSRPHLRCGICDEPFKPGENTVYVDDERCHRSCADSDGIARFELDEDAA